MPLQGILQIGVSSLKAQQTALAVTSHNISNSNTDGYSRQRVNLSEIYPMTTTPGQLGLGVEVTDVTRMRDSLLDGNVRLQVGQQAKYDELTTDTQSLEGVFGTPTSTSIGAALTDFFNGFQNLTTGPEDLSTRQVVIENGIALADSFGNATDQLNGLTTGLDLSVNQAASDINSMLDQVSVMNKQISAGEVGGNHANDLRDQRDLLLDHLSQYMDISSTEQANGMVNITVNGEALVTNNTYSAVQVASVGTPAHPEVQSAGGVSLTTAGGKLSGIAQAYQNIDQTRTSLDGMAKALITNVNNLATAGFDLDGTAGVAFFTGTDAATIGVNAAVQADPRKVVAADAATPGSNGIALQMVALQDKAVYPPPPGTPSATLNQSIGNLVVQLGSEGKRASDMSSTYQTSVKALQDQRQSISGVSTDEELTNMIRYQHAYEAASRIITTVDEMMTTVLHMGAGR
jgi:flagellar hook-associated protein 1 FlgK